MGEIKTQATDADVTAFLEAATPQRRRDDGIELASMFREVTGVDPVYMMALADKESSFSTTVKASTSSARSAGQP